MAEIFKKLTPASSMWSKLRSMQNMRYLSQLGFLIFMGVIVYLKNLYGSGNQAVSPESYCPLGGFETLYFSLINGGNFIENVRLSNMVLFIAILVTSIIAGGFFCGWVCPLGAIQQTVTGTRRWLQKRVRHFSTFAVWLNRKSKSLAFMDRWLKYAKYLVLAWIIWGTVTAGIMVFRNFDPWSGIINIWETGITIGFWVFIGTVVAAVIGDRVWCRYLCPLGAIIGLVGKIGLIRVQREAKTCTGCQLCSRKCPMNIKVHAQTRVTATECNMCLKCVDVCPSPSALEARLGLPVPGKSSTTQVEGSNE